MTEVIIEGWLGKIVGKKWNLNVRSFLELFNAIESNTNQLRKNLINNKKNYFAIFVDGEKVEEKALMFIPIKGKKVKILPVLYGATSTVAAWIVAKVGITAGTFAYSAAVFILDTVIATAISFGISLLIAKLLAPDDPEVRNTTSFVFTNGDNVASQGKPVPLGYGRMMVGSQVISTSQASLDKGVFENIMDKGNAGTLYGLDMQMLGDVNQGGKIASRTGKVKA